jgi:hypothetical protein
VDYLGGIDRVLTAHGDRVCHGLLRLPRMDGIGSWLSARRRSVRSAGRSLSHMKEQGGFIVDRAVGGALEDGPIMGS